MKYQVGDKVKLKNGCVVTITDILEEYNAYGYGYPVKCIAKEDEVLYKIEE